MAGALLRLVGSVLVEAHDEWEAGKHRHLPGGSMTPPATPAPDPTEQPHPHCSGRSHY
jgi:putative transposase